MCKVLLWQNLDVSLSAEWGATPGLLVRPYSINDLIPMSTLFLACGSGPDIALGLSSRKAPTEVWPAKSRPTVLDPPVVLWVHGATLFYLALKRAQNERWVKCSKFVEVSPDPCMTTLLMGSLSLNPHIIVCIVSLIPGSTHLNVSPEGIKRDQNERWVKCSKMCRSVAGPMYDNTFERFTLPKHPHIVMHCLAHPGINTS